MDDVQDGMVRVLQATLDAEAEGPGDLTSRIRTAMQDASPEQFTDLVILLKNSRCLDVVAERDGDGKPVISRIKGLTTRGLRVLQQASEAAAAVHSCPTDGDDGRMGFDGR
jgi:hypothetical protein